MAVKRKIEAVGDSNVQNDDGVHPTRRVRVEYGEKDTKLAKIYSDLADDVSKTRITAAANLIRAQTDFSRQDKIRVLERLIRGLCSNRKAARSGFFIALSELLSVAVKKFSVGEDDFQTSEVLERIHKFTSPEATGSKREKRDYALGRCMALTALLKSRYLVSHKSFWSAIIDDLIEVAAQGAVLQREAGAVLHSSLAADGVDDDEVSLLLERLQHSRMLKTAEGLAIWLTARQKHPNAAFPAGIWHKDDPLCSKDRASVVAILKGNTDPSTDEIQASGAAQSMPSFAWPVILEALSTKKDKDFSQFWQEAVDDGHFASSASTERKSLGLQILTMALGTVRVELVPRLFTKNLLRCIINHRSNKQSNLHQSAKIPLDTLVLRANKQPSVINKTINSLIGIDGAVNFDVLTKTKTVDSLVSLADDAELAGLICAIETQIMRPTSSDHTDAEGTRRAMADMCTNIARSVITRRSEDDGISVAMLHNLESVTALMARIGYLEPTTEPAEPKVSDATQEVFRNRCITCLGFMLKSRTEGVRRLVCRLGLTTWASAKSGEARLLIKPDENIMMLLRTAGKNIGALQKKSEAKGSKARAPQSALLLLYSMSFLQALGGDADSLSMLEDLALCHQSYESGEGTTVMLIEILLSFLSRQSAVSRNIAEQVFAAFAPDMTEEGFQSMLNILQKKESTSGQEELFELEDDNMDIQDEEASSDDEKDSDIEVVDVEDDSCESDSDGASDNEPDQSADVEDEETKAFEAKLAQALGASRAGAADKDDEAPDTTDESDMDDEQMMALESHLTTIFKERAKQTSKRQDNKEAKTNMTNFKNRVLDLLSIYVKNQSDNALVLTLIVPLLQVIRGTSSRQTSEKAFGCLKQLSESCTRHKAFPKSERLALATLEQVHSAMGVKAVKLHGTACSRASLFLAKTLVSADVAHFGAVSEMYARLQREWYLDPGSKVPGSVFTEWTSWCIATRKTKA